MILKQIMMFEVNKNKDISSLSVYIGLQKK